MASLKQEHEASSQHRAVWGGGGGGYSQHGQHPQRVLLDVQGPQHRVQVGQIFGQQLPTLVDQLTQLSHLAWGANGADVKPSVHNPPECLHPSLSG